MNSDEGLETLRWLETKLDPSRWQRVLYIGWHPKTFGEWDGDWYLNHIRGLTKGTAPKHTIMEACPAYAAALAEHPVRKRYSIRVINDDITKFVKNSTEKFDVIVWWHGPEHVEQEQLGPTLKGLEAMCTGAVVIGCPDGDVPYEDPEGDDRHRCAISESLMHDFGYQTRLIDRTWKAQEPAIAAIKLCA